MYTNKINCLTKSRCISVLFSCECELINVEGFSTGSYIAWGGHFMKRFLQFLPLPGTSESSTIYYLLNILSIDPNNK